MKYVDQLTKEVIDRLPRYTTAQRDALTPLEGWIILNTTTSSAEVYVAGSWVAASALFTFMDNAFRVYDNIDNTKQMAFEVSGIDTGTTRTVTARNSDGTMAYTEDFIDNNFEVSNSVDGTKKVALDVSNVTTGNTRTLTIPDKDGTIATLSDILETIFNVTSEPNGFPNYSNDSTISYVNGTRTFTIAPTGGTFDVAVGGTVYSKTTENIVWSDIEGMHYFYYNQSGVLTHSTTFDIAIIMQHAFVAALYWDATNSQVIYLANERHGTQMDGATHGYLHLTNGTQYRSGAALTVSNTDGSGDLASDAELSMAEGVFADEDITYTNAAKTNFYKYYKSGASGDWRRVDSNTFGVTTTGTGRAAWNEFTGATWQLSEVPNQQFVLSHIFANNDADGEHYLCIVGENTYTTINTARAGATEELANLIAGELPFEEFVPIGTIIYQTSDSYTNAVKSRTRTTDLGDDFVNWLGQNLSPTTSPSNHSNLSGLNNDDHKQYQKTATSVTNLTGNSSLTSVIPRNSYYTLDGSSSSVQLTLPDISTLATGYNLKIKAVDLTNAVTLKGFSSDNIEGSNTFTFTALNQIVEVTYTGTQWSITQNSASTSDGAGIGGINYASNFDYELNIDGVTGDTNLTVSQETVSPLIGTGSLKISKGGTTNTSGQKVQLDNDTIDTNFQSKILQARFYFDNPFDTGDFVVKCYDETNAQYLLGTFDLPSGSDLFTGTWQMNSNTLDTRIEIECVTIETTNDDILIDNYYFGEQDPISYGAPVTDWESFTPDITGTSTAGSMTYSLQSARWRRVGSNAEFSGRIAIDTVTVAPTGNLRINVPSFLQADVKGENEEANEGSIYFFDSSTSEGFYCPVAIEDGQASISIRAKTGTPIGLPTLGNGDQFRFWASIPIQGWSSNTVLSSTLASPTTKAELYNAPAQTIVGGAGFTDIDFDSVFTTGDISDNGTGGVVIEKSGYYNLGYNLFVNYSASLPSSTQSIISINDGVGVNDRYGSDGQVHGQSGSYTHSGSAFDVFLNKGDVVKVKLNTGTNDVTISSGLGRLNKFIVSYSTKNFQTIAIQEKVFVKAKDSSGNPIGNSNTDLTYSTEVEDSTGSFDHTTGIFTAKRDMIISIELSNLYDSDSWSSGSYSTYVLLIDTGSGFGISEYTGRNPVDAAFTGFRGVQGQFRVKLNRGDKCKVALFQNGKAGTINLISTLTYNQISIMSED